MSISMVGSPRSNDDAPGPFRFVGPAPEPGVGRWPKAEPASKVAREKAPMRRTPFATRWDMANSTQREPEYRRIIHRRFAGTPCVVRLAGYPGRPSSFFLCLNSRSQHLLGSRRFELTGLRGPSFQFSAHRLETVVCPRWAFFCSTCPFVQFQTAQIGSVSLLPHCVWRHNMDSTLLLSPGANFVLGIPIKGRSSYNVVQATRCGGGTTRGFALASSSVSSRSIESARFLRQTWRFSSPWWCAPWRQHPDQGRGHRLRRPAD